MKVKISEYDWDQIVWDSNAIGTFPEYSGRNMYGAKCPSMTVKDLSDIYEIGIAFRDYVPDAAYSIEVKVDNFGLDHIVYFPNLEVLKNDV